MLEVKGWMRGGGGVGVVRRARAGRKSTVISCVQWRRRPLMLSMNLVGCFVQSDRLMRGRDSVRMRNHRVASHSSENYQAASRFRIGGRRDVHACAPLVKPDPSIHDCPDIVARHTPIRLCPASSDQTHISRTALSFHHLITRPRWRPAPTRMRMRGRSAAMRRSPWGRLKMQTRI